MKSISIKHLKILPVLCLIALGACHTPTHEQEEKKSVSNSTNTINSEALMVNPEKTQNMMTVN